MTEAVGRTKADLIIGGAAEMVTCQPRGGDPLGRLRDGWLAAAGGRIVAVGSREEVAAAVDVSQARRIDATGMIVAPGFVDCHTHLVFAGSRAKEYAFRLRGSADQWRGMGNLSGIPATVAMTRAAGAEELRAQSRDRLERMLKFGSTTVESKSGYGLSLEDEIRQLEVNRALAESQPATVVSTLLAAHDFPPEKTRERWVDEIVAEMIPAVAQGRLAEFCDVYCDEGYFSPAQTRRILTAGMDNGLRPKIHADAYSPSGGADLAAELGAVSADHLNHTTPEQMSRLAAAGVTAVLMPALDFAVRHPRPFDAGAMRRAGLRLALATDLCPACWVEGMHLVMVLACRLYGLSLEEALLAATVGGAWALGRQDELGSLAVGKACDAQIWRLPMLEELIYRLDHLPIAGVIKNGRVVFPGPEEHQQI